MSRSNLLTALSTGGLDKIWRALPSDQKSIMQSLLDASEEGKLKSSKLMHVSHSQIAEYMKCGMYYFFNRIDPKAPKFMRPYYFQYGGAYHDGLETGLSEKLKDGVEPNINAMTDSFFESFQEDFDEVDWVDQDPGLLETRGIELVKLYRNNIIHTIEPELVETMYDIEFENWPYKLRMKPDLEANINNKLYLIDHKTSKQTPSIDSARTAEQLTNYALGRKVRTGEIPRVRFDFAVQMKSGPTKIYKDKYSATKYPDKKHGGGFVGIYTLESQRTEKDISRYLAMVRRATQDIMSGQYHESMDMKYCNESGCNFWAHCKLN